MSRPPPRIFEQPVFLASQQQLPAVPCDNVHNPALLRTLALAVEDVSVDARLETVLQVRQRVEVEVEQPFAVPVSDSAGEQVAQEALVVSRMRTATTEAKASERRQLVSRDLYGFVRWDGAQACGSVPRGQQPLLSGGPVV